MDLMKDFFGSSDPKPESKVQPKSVPKVEPKSVAKVELKPAPKAEPKSVTKVEPKPVAKVESKPEPKAQPVDNEKLRRLEQELKQAERDYTDSIWPLMAAKRQYFLLKNGYDRDPANSSKEAVLEASADVADCQERQDKINRRRKSLKKQIAELKGGANSQ